MTADADPGAYGRTWAADYDELYEHRGDQDQVCSFVLGLVPAGADVLELGVGTGRLAVPMALAGLAVTGVDASAEMLALLRGRPGAEQVRVVEGDFTAVDASGPFDLALIAFSTLFLVPTQELQLRCLANIHRQLRPGGHLVVEAFVPDHSRWVRGQNVSVGRLDGEAVSLKVSVHDPVNQVIATQDLRISPSGSTLRPNRLRYIWPAELDAMALASGLSPVRRHADWSGAPFTARSTSHVSVYQRSDVHHRPDDAE